MTTQDLNPKGHALTDSEYQNLYDLASKLTELEKDCPYEFHVNSGYRTVEEQHRVDPNHPQSAHIFGCAVDLEDYDFELWYWLVDNINTVKMLGLYLEDEFADSGHVHIQSIPPKSGRIIFEP